MPPVPGNLELALAFQGGNSGPISDRAWSPFNVNFSPMQSGSSGLENMGQLAVVGGIFLVALFIWKKA